MNEPLTLEQAIKLIANQYGIKKISKKYKLQQQLKGSFETNDLIEEAAELYCQSHKAKAFEAGWQACINRWDDKDKTHKVFLQSELEEYKSL